MVCLIASIQRMKNGRSAESIEESEERIDDRSPADDDSSKELSKDQMFDILRNSRRRTVLSCLRTRGRELSVREISTCVAAEEYGVPATELSPEQYKRVYTGLYQCHLERMAELGVIDFDKDENIVRLNGVGSQFDPYLDSEQRLYAVGVELGIAVAAASVVTLGATGIGPIGTVSPVLLALVTIVALLGLALAQLFKPSKIALFIDRTLGFNPFAGNP